MNSSELRLLLNDDYEYKYLEKIFSENELEKYKQSINQKFSKINWSDETYSEYIIRNYLAIKMILSSTIMLTSCDYSIDHNLRVTEPYLFYYSLLNCCRSMLFISPDLNWNDGGLITSTHSKIINCAITNIAILNKEVSESIRNLLTFLKDYRELFSYSFPASGLATFQKDEITIDSTIKYCGIICEIAQLTSELLSQSFFKRNENLSYSFIEEYKSKGFLYSIGKERIIDKEDWYRLDYITRKHKSIFSLYHTMTEGLVEDFFSSWASEESESGYDPDIDWRIIFSVP